MAHCIETMFSARVAPWHGLGNIVSEALTTEDALRMSGLDWRVEQTDVSVNGEVVTGYKANVRNTDGRVLGIVSDRYTVIQNQEAFEFIDHLLGKGVRYETAGSLRSGKRVWMLANMDNQIAIRGEKIAPYMVFTSTHDASGAVKVALTATRVVCQNTLTIGLNNAQRTWTTHHTGDLGLKMMEAERTLELATNYYDQLGITIADMMDANLYADEVRKFVIDLFPVSDQNTDGEKDSIYDMREYLERSIYHAPDLHGKEETKWGVYNAVSDLVCHMEPKRCTQTYYENRFLKIADGHPIMRKAQELLNQIGA